MQQKPLLTGQKNLHRLRFIAWELITLLPVTLSQQELNPIKLARD